MIVSIDHGNKQIKTVHKVFTSGLAESAKRPFGEDVVFYQGKYYSLTENRIPFKWDKSSDETFFVLSLFAIAYEIEAAGCYAKDEIIGVDLVVGLPPAHYAHLRAKFESYFKRMRDSYIDFEFQRRPYYIEIDNVHVYPQGYAAAMTAYDYLKDKPKAYVVDIGGMTVDCLPIHNGRLVDSNSCISLEEGVINFYDMIQGKFSGEYGMLLDDRQIDAMLGGDDVLEDPQTMEFINEQAQAFVERMLGYLRERKVDLRTVPAVFVGGGSMLLKKYIEPSEAVGRCVFIDDVCANAKGYDFLYRARKAAGGRA